MYKVEQITYDPARIVSFAPRLEERMNERASEGWVLMGQPMVSEKLAFVILFWFKAEEPMENMYEHTRVTDQPYDATGELVSSE